MIGAAGVPESKRLIGREGEREGGRGDFLCP